MKTLLVPLLLALILWTLQAFAPPISQSIARWWVRIYTWRLPDEIRALRSGDAAAFYGELWRDMLRDGCKAEHVALRLVANVVRGAKHDIAWRWDIDHAGSLGRLRRNRRIVAQMVFLTTQAAMLAWFAWYEVGSLPVAAVVSLLLVASTVSVGWQMWQTEKIMDGILLQTKSDKRRPINENRPDA